MEIIFRCDFIIVAYWLIIIDFVLFQIKSKAYIVYPKIENQPYFGCEVNTLSEITQQWINLLVAPSTTLLQGEC